MVYLFIQDIAVLSRISGPHKTGKQEFLHLSEPGSFRKGVQAPAKRWKREHEDEKFLIPSFCSV